MVRAVKRVLSMKIACIILWAEDRRDIFIWLLGLAWYDSSDRATEAASGMVCIMYSGRIPSAYKLFRMDISTLSTKSASLFGIRFGFIQIFASFLIH